MNMFDKLTKYFNKGIYTKNHIISFVKSGVITTDQYEIIVGEAFPEDVSVEKEPTAIEVLQADTKMLNAKVQALTESNQFLEDCIVEMAEIVYA